MFALDTNVLVRYIMQDDPAQTELVTQYIESLTSDDPAFISSLVLCELCWVLKSAYGASRQDCATAIEAILEVPVFTFDDGEICSRALQSYIAGSADFSDFVIRETALSAQCDGVKTFDKNALREKGFVPL